MPKPAKLAAKIRRFQEQHGCVIPEVSVWEDQMLQEIACDQVVYSSDPVRHIDLSVVHRDFGETSAGSAHRVHLRLAAAWKYGGYHGDPSNAAVAKAIGANPGALSSFMSRTFWAGEKPRRQFAHINTQHLARAATLFQVSHQWLIDGRRFTKDPDRRSENLMPEFLDSYESTAKHCYALLHGGREEHVDDDIGILDGIDLPSLDETDVESWVDIVMRAIDDRAAICDQFSRFPLQGASEAEAQHYKEVRRKLANATLTCWLEDLPVMPDYVSLLLRIRREREERKRGSTFTFTLSFEEVRDVLLGLELAQNAEKPAVDQDIVNHFADLTRHCLLGADPEAFPRYRPRRRLPDLLNLSFKIAQQAFPSPQPPLAKPRRRGSKPSSAKSM